MRRVYRRRFASLDSTRWDAREYLRSRLALLHEFPPTTHLEPHSADAAREWGAEELILRMIQKGVPEADPCTVENGRRELASFLRQASNVSITWERCWWLLPEAKRRRR